MRLAATALAELEREIRRSEELRYAHRLHAVVLKGNGLTYLQVSESIGESVRTVKHWVRAYVDPGVGGLREEKIQDGYPV